MEERATGIILRLHPFTETSLIVHWLASAQGRLVTLAKGARRPKSPFRGKLDLFFMAAFSFHKSRRSEIHILREIELRETFPSLRKHLGALRQAAYAANLIEQFTEPDAAVPELSGLLHDFLLHISNAKPATAPVLAFELKLLQHVGLCPAPENLPLTPGAKALSARLLADDWADLPRLQLSQQQENEISTCLQRLIGTHLGRVPSRRQPALRAADL